MRLACPRRSVCKKVYRVQERKRVDDKIADEWQGRRTDEPETDVTVDGPVDLDPADLLKSLQADHVTVRCVRTIDGNRITLDPSQKVMRGVLYVTAEEQDRFRTEYLSAETAELKKIEEERLKSAPSYLDPDHPHYSNTLAIAVEAWIAQYEEGGFEPISTGHLNQLEMWLRKNHPDLSKYARERIAGVVNPNKTGGNPITKKS